MGWGMSNDERELTPIGSWIKRYLEKNKMSERELGKRMEYSHAQISRVKFGDSKPSTNFIRKLAYATGATENELLIIAFGQIRYEAARANARRIMESSSGVQEALRGIAIYLSQLPPRDPITIKYHILYLFFLLSIDIRTLSVRTPVLLPRDLSGMFHLRL